MTGEGGGKGTTTRAWGIAAVVGVLAGILLATAGDWGVWRAAFAALVAIVVLGFLLGWLFRAPADASPARAPAAPPPPPAAPPPPPPAAPPAPSAVPPVAAPPPPLAAARAGGADDLKEIKGVGPKLEEMLHRMGIFHFDQIAAWGAAELAWVDENLEGFRGRASRDRWVEQARDLAAGRPAAPGPGGRA
ncbi:MAG: NADH:ubiquinone oxidoreductase [Rhodobacteraceae bacterium]|nr:NADH:ubiquinone oxidoreductase [Paracoccaceae bacterium]